MALADFIIIVSRGGGAFVTRWLHVIVGICWIGLLYYFNFVQVPAFAEMEAAARNNAIDKLASRALWWFRWAAAATLVTGLLILIIQKDGSKSQLFSGDYFKTVPGMAIATGILLATHDVRQRLVRDLAEPEEGHRQRPQRAGRGEADPAAAPAARKAALASRQNTIYSFTMLLFMVGTAHFFLPGLFKFAPSGGDRATYWAFAVVIWLVLELNALGVIGGTGAGGTNWIYDHHKNAIITGFVLVVVYYVLFYLVLKA